MFAPDQPPELKPAALWGTEELVRELFGDRVSTLAFKDGQHTHRFRSVEHYVDFLLTYYGRTLKASDSLDDARRKEFAAEIAEAVRLHNRATDGPAAWEVDYLIVSATKR